VDSKEVKQELDQIKAEVADLKQDLEQAYGELEAVSAFIALILTTESDGESARALVGRASIRDARSDFNVGIERFKHRLLANLQDKRP